MGQQNTSRYSVREEAHGKLGGMSKAPNCRLHKQICTCSACRYTASVCIESSICCKHFKAVKQWQFFQNLSVCVELYVRTQMYHTMGGTFATCKCTCYLATCKNLAGNDLEDSQWASGPVSCPSASCMLYLGILCLAPWLNRVSR